MTSSVFDYKAINSRCREISSDILGPKLPPCHVCQDVGWTLQPDPRIGFPDQPYPCNACGNRYGYPKPLIVDTSVEEIDLSVLGKAPAPQTATQAQAAAQRTRFPSKKF